MSGRATNQRSSWARPEKTTTRDRECQFCLSRYRFVEVRRYNSKKYCSKQCHTLDQDELDDYNLDDDTDMTAFRPQLPAPPAPRPQPPAPPAPRPQPPVTPAPRPHTKTPITPTLPGPKPEPQPQQPSNEQLKTIQEESDRVYTWVMDAIDELTAASAELSRAKGRTVPLTRPASRQPAPQHLTIATTRTFIDMQQRLLIKTNNAIRTTRQQITTTRPKAISLTVAPRPKTTTPTSTTGLRKPIAFVPATPLPRPQTPAGATAAQPRPGPLTLTLTPLLKPPANPESPRRQPVVRVSGAAMEGS